MDEQCPLCSAFIKDVSVQIFLGCVCLLLQDLFLQSRSRGGRGAGQKEIAELWSNMQQLEALVPLVKCELKFRKWRSSDNKWNEDAPSCGGLEALSVSWPKITTYTR